MSSNNFIIARHKDCTLENIKDVIPWENAKYFVIDDAGYTCVGETVNEILKTKTMKVAIDYVTQKFAEEIYNLPTHMEINDWRITYAYGTDETDDFLEMFLYTACGEIHYDNIKIVQV